MEPTLARAGRRLRAARQGRGWTLDDLAARTAISPSTLSRLESGKRSLTLDLLVPLTRQLAITIDDLVAEDTADPRVRRETLTRGGLAIEPLTPADAPVATYKITYPPAAALPELRSHDGYEWLYVLSGKIRLRLGDQDLTLTRGEAAEFATRVPHAISASGGRAATTISIFNESGARIHTHGAVDADEKKDYI